MRVMRLRVQMTQFATKELRRLTRELEDEAVVQGVIQPEDRQPTRVRAHAVVRSQPAIEGPSR